MVGEVAISEVVLKTRCIGAVPAVASHDRTLEACITDLLYQQRNGIKEAGIEYEVRLSSDDFGSLSGKVGISRRALAGVDDIDSGILGTVEEGILQSV